MPLPTRTNSTRIPGSKANHAVAGRDVSPVKQIPTPSTTTFARTASHSLQNPPNRQIVTRSQSNTSPVDTDKESRQNPRDVRASVTSHAGSSSSRPSLENGSASSRLVRAKSLRKPPETNIGPPTSFKMPLRLAQSGTAARSTHSSSSRGQARDILDSPSKSETKRRSSSQGASRRISSTNDSVTSVPQTPTAQTRPRPPSSSSQYPRRPTSASSTSMPSHSVSRKQDFSINQSRFNTPSKMSATASNHPKQSIDQARQQMHLLHLHELYSKADQNLAAFSQSAHKKLSAQYSELQDLYATSLRLSHSAHQQRNLLALTWWTNGNTAVLERKLSTLCAILGDISKLTAPTRPHDLEAGLNVAAVEAQGAGPYTQLTEQFTAWVSYVLEVWENRDATSQREQENSANVIEDDDSISIEGLGDAAKTNIRQLADMVSALVVRIEDVRAVPVPNVDVHLPGDESGDRRLPRTTPAVLVHYAGTLLDCMAEELQLMREIEFEVVIGEKAWVDERTRRAQADVDGGFSTPRSFRNVF